MQRNKGGKHNKRIDKPAVQITPGNYQRHNQPDEQNISIDADNQHEKKYRREHIRIAGRPDIVKRSADIDSRTGRHRRQSRINA